MTPICDNMSNMTREQAANIIKDMGKRCVDAGEIPYDQIVDACAIAVDTLRGPQPDPDTGLVPCGCGGKAKVWCLGPAVPTHFTPVVSVYEVGCTECAITTRRVSGKQENAVKAWNTAMGWKGGAPLDIVQALKENGIETEEETP